MTDFRDNGDHLVVYSHEVSQSPDKHVSQSREDRCPILIGCDGKNSTLRRMAGIAFVGGPYPDTYVMGDFLDLEYPQSPPYIYISPEGLVESFRLLNKKKMGY